MSALDHSAADEALIARASGVGCAAPFFDRAHYPDAFAAWARRAAAVVACASGVRPRDGADLATLRSRADLWSGAPAPNATSAACDTTRPA